MAKHTKYSVTDISNIPIANRDINGEYHLRTSNGFQIYRVLNNPSRDFVPVEIAIPLATESNFGLMSARDKMLLNHFIYDHLFLHFNNAFMNNSSDLVLDLSVDSDNDFDNIFSNTHVSQQSFEKSTKTADVVDIGISCSIKFENYQGNPPILGLQITINGVPKHIIELPFSYSNTNDKKIRFSYTPYTLDLSPNSIVEFSIIHIDGDLADTYINDILIKVIGKIL